MRKRGRTSRGIEAGARPARNGLLALVLLLITCSPGTAPQPASAQDIRPEDMKKMYDDALVQLKAAQERKNQLAAENEKLTAQVNEMKKQIEQMQQQMDDLKRADAEHDQKTFFLRAHYAAWKEFIRQYPDLYGRWKLFLHDDLIKPAPILPDGIDLGWPSGEQG